MTTSTTTSNNAATEAASAAQDNVAFPDEASLAQIANALFNELPTAPLTDQLSSSTLHGELVRTPVGAGAVPRISQDVLRTVPAGAAGASGQAPDQFLTLPTGTQSVDLPVSPAATLFDPLPLGSGLQSYSRTVRPADHPTVPGVRFASIPPKTPGLEVGAQPLVPRLPPAAAFGLPDERGLRELPGALVGVSGLGIELPSASAPGADGLYFLGESPGLRNVPPAPTPFASLPASGLPEPAGQAIAQPSVPGTALPDAASAAPTSALTAQLPSVPDAGEPHYVLGESTALAAEAKGTPATAEAGADAVDLYAADRHPGFDVNAVRKDFPILRERVHGHDLIWFDNAATTQKPQAVIDRLSYFYEHENSNIHRAAHALAARATDAYEAARSKVAKFLNAASAEEIVFVRGTTEGINLVAQSWGRRNIGEGDEIIISWLEHHANIVPWQLLCKETGAKIRVAPVDDSGQILLDEYEKLFNRSTRLVAFSQVSNALGTITPAQEMVAIAHRHGACVLVDGAQAVSHMAVDVQALDCDWYVFSGHKVFAPTGIGAVYGRKALLDNTPPWQGGGNMIHDVTFERTIFQPAPARFEAGTGNIADAVGLGAAIDYVQRLGMDNIARYEHALLEYGTEGLLSVPGLRLIGTAREKASVLSFVLDGHKSEEVGAALNREGIAVRSGHHCAQPILRRFGLETTVRPSLAFYNTCAEVDALVGALQRLQGGRTTLRL